MRALINRVAAGAMILLGLLPGAAQADPIIPVSQAEKAELTNRIDKGRVGIVTGSPTGVYMRLGSDLAKLAEAARGDGLRVIVMEGRGSVGNLQDLALLKYTDFALVQADVLNHMAKTNPSDFQYFQDKLRYVARFHPEAVHILARGGPFHGPEDLKGKTIAIDGPNSGTGITLPLILHDMLHVDVNFVPMDPNAAFADLVSDDPKLDGFAYVTGKGAKIFTGLKDKVAALIGQRRISFVPFPGDPPRDSPYVWDVLTADTYPSLIAPGQTVAVWAVPAVLAAYDWDRRVASDRLARVEEFVNAFFDNRLQLGQGGFADNWCAIDLANTVEGWTRLKVAENWLTHHPGVQTTICQPASAPDPTSCPAFLQAMQRGGFSLPALGGAVRPLFDNWMKSNPGRC